MKPEATIEQPGATIVFEEEQIYSGQKHVNVISLSDVDS